MALSLRAWNNGPHILMEDILNLSLTSGGPMRGIRAGVCLPGCAWTVRISILPSARELAEGSKRSVGLNAVGSRSRRDSHQWRSGDGVVIVRLGVKTFSVGS